MRKVLMSLAVLGALAVASSSFAAVGTVYMGWNSCNTATPLTDITVSAGQATGINIMCYVNGCDTPSTAYQVQILYGDVNKQVPDAWRFDPAGCQGSAFVVINHLAPASVVKTCPSFQDAGGAQQSLQIKDLSFSPPALHYATTLERISCANAYPNGGGNIPVAGTTYFLADAEFNETFGSVGPTPVDLSTCGGIETQMCFNLMSASLLPLDGIEVPFNFHGGADWATTNGLGASCQASPAQTRTWGQIKNQYRN